MNNKQPNVSSAISFTTVLVLLAVVICIGVLAYNKCLEVQANERYAESYQRGGTDVRGHGVDSNGRIRKKSDIIK